MAKSRHIQRTSSPEPDSGGVEPQSALFAGCGLALLVARHVLPAESAHLGETLWIVALWLLLAFGWSVVRMRVGAARLQWDRADVAVLLLAVGHVISGLLVYGNRRAALNGLWEWVGMAVAVCLLRRWLASAARWQQGLAVIATAGVVLSGLGVEQYAVTYPALRSEVAELISLEQRESDGNLSQQDLRRYQQLRNELGQIATDSDPNSRLALRQRLMASTEPLACFALANTLAGVLAVSLLLLAGAASSAIARGESRWHVARILAPALLVAFCLVLTKSRTGWVGLLGGAAVWAAIAWRGAWLTRRSLAIVMGSSLAIVLLTGIAISAGALDALVLLEAPKSLRYRLEYWTGAWGVIRDHSWVGVGPGNFRQNYLRHKVAGSSEEILDPHNMFLDVWAGGGLIALAGLLLAGSVALKRWRQTAVANSATSDDQRHTGSFDRRFVLVSGAAGIMLVWIKLGLIEMQWDQRLLALLCGWIVAVLILPPLRFSATAQMAAGVALGIHLLGAGGIGMPVISTTLFLLWLGPAMPVVCERAHEPAADRSRRWTDIGMCVGFAGLTAGCLYTAVIPSTLSNLYTEAAISVMTRSDVAAARRYLEQAIAADRLDPEPHVYLAQLEHEQFKQTGSLQSGEKAIGCLTDAIFLDLSNPKTFLLQAQWSLELLRRSDNPQWEFVALDAARMAAMRDPHNAQVLATLATAYAESGEDEHARETAAQALALNELNQALGHLDRLLDGETLDALRKLTGEQRE